MPFSSICLTLMAASGVLVAAQTQSQSVQFNQVINLNGDVSRAPSTSLTMPSEWLTRS